MLGPGAPFAIYLALQVFALMKLRGIWRIVALVPVPIQILVLASTVEAYRAESNLWPIGLIASGTAASVALALLLLCHMLRERLKRGS